MDRVCLCQGKRMLLVWLVHSEQNGRLMPQTNDREGQLTTHPGSINLIYTYYDAKLYS